MPCLHFIIPCTHAVSYFVLNVLLVGQWHKVGSGIVPWTFGLKGALGIRANVIGNDCFCGLLLGFGVFAAFLPERLLLPGTIQRNVVYVLFNKKRMRRLVFVICALPPPSRLVDGCQLLCALEVTIFGELGFEAPCSAMALARLRCSLLACACLFESV